ncbi:MAG TPA: SH3 domain-containing protein [Anaerolineales bacterium]|nr:SH3 domain-containing protein [Anaerolineales bacterium]
MRKLNSIYRLAGFGLIAIFLLVSCSPAATQGVPAGATATQPPAASPVAPTATVPAAPTMTNTAAPTATATAAQTATTAPAATSAPTAAGQGNAQIVPSINAYCRKGPSSNYYQITFLMKGNAYNVVGRDATNSWWLVQAPGNVTCWVGDPNATKQGPVDQVTVAAAQPLPSTPAFVDSYTCNTTANTLDVALNWSTVAYATGFRLYRNGTLLVYASPTVTSFTDSAPLGAAVIYELAAYNDYGEAARISVTVPACE